LCASILDEFTVLLYPLWARGGGGGMQHSYCHALQSDHVAQHASLDCHLAASVLPDAVHQTATHDANRHAARAPRRLAEIGLQCSEALSISRLLVVTFSRRLVMTNTESLMLLSRKTNVKPRFFC